MNIHNNMAMYDYLEQEVSKRWISGNPCIFLPLALFRQFWGKDLQLIFIIAKLLFFWNVN